MIPEISRRCLACGAAVRARASFCPYCGKKLEFAQSSSATPPETTPESAEDFDAAKTRTNFHVTTQTPADNINLPLTKELNEHGQRTAIYTPKDEMPVSSSLSETIFPTPTVEPAVKEDFSLAIAETAPLSTFVPAENSNSNLVVNEPASEPSAQQNPVGAPVPVEQVATEENTEQRGRRVVVARAEKYGERSRQQAEKLRGRSAALIEEASDDPGLRFVLISVLLFLVFLVFLVFSQIIG